MEAGQYVRDFRLEERIGAGGVGEVWRARHQHLDTTVAIKAIYPHLSREGQFQDRSLLEAIALAKLEHPHIVRVHDFFIIDGDPYLVMSYIDGPSLHTLISRDGPLPLERALRISRGILDALNFAHRRGVIHRDVKPSNILVGADDHAFLVDFGIALVVGRPRVTRMGTYIGTPEYMSPEQIQGYDVDHRTDVYSFGCVLYEMLTGRPPFGSQDEGKAEFHILSGHLHEAPASIRALNPKVDEELAAVVCTAMAKKPDDRYGGCQALADALRLRIRALPPPPPPTPWWIHVLRTHLLRKHVLLPLLLLGLVAIYYLAVPGSPPPTPASPTQQVLQKIDQGQLVTPQGTSAYDVWRRYKHTAVNPPAFGPEVEHTISGKLRHAGEQFFRDWHATFRAENAAWTKISRIYEWAIYLHTLPAQAGTTIHDDIRTLCANMSKDVKRLCALHSYSIGQMYFRQGRLKSASQSYDRAQYYDSSMCLSYVGIGDIYMQQKKVANAIKPYLRSIACDAQLCYGHFKLGNLYQLRRLHDVALEFYTKSYQCSTNNPDFIYQKANTHNTIGQYCTALQLYRDLIKILHSESKSEISLTEVEKSIHRIESKHTCN